MTASSLRNSLFVLFLAALTWAQEVPDTYRWLEDASSPKVQNWVAKENAAAEDYLSRISGKKEITARMGELYEVNSVSLPKEAGARLFYKRTLIGHEQPVFYWQPLEHPEAEHLWLDSSVRTSSSLSTVGDWVPSPNGAWVAYAAHPQGADEAVLHVRSIASGEDEPRDVIPGANFADVAWSPDSRGFYYLRLPVDPSIAEAERVAHADIRYHEMGRDPSRDVLIYPPTGDASVYLTPQVSADGQWLFVMAARGWTSNEIYYARRQGPTVRFKSLFSSTMAIATVAEDHGWFYLQTNQAAPHGKVLRKKPQEMAWESIIPERRDVTIESMRLAGGYVVLSVLQNASNAVETYRPNGQPAWQVPVPDKGNIWEISGKENQDDFFVEYQSFFVPPRIYRANVSERKLKIWNETDLQIDISGFEANLVWYKSKDGTPVSMMIVHRKNLIRDGKAPVLLEGYGGFNTPILPRFSQEILAWLEMGGVYAVPHLRGGGEYGEAWHQAGMLTHKQNTFDDFIAAAEYLIQERYTRADRLAIQGASNGGLLVTAAMTQRPDLFRAVICKNPLTDMVRYSLFGEGKAWIPEYGAPDKPEEFKALLAYSPYHHIVQGTSYPSLLMLAGEHDDRVDPMHARKFVAALQAANTSRHPILFKLLPHSGHSNSDRLTAQTEETADRILFLKKELSL